MSQANDRGAIAAGHVLTAQIGAQVLVEGGNAIDAAVAAAFASCVVEPTLTGIGGAGFATIHCADGTEVCLDFFASMPGKDGPGPDDRGPVPVEVDFSDSVQVFHVGARSCAVPGFVAGVLHAHSRFGTLPLERVLSPAVGLARDGVEITAPQAFCHSILRDILLRNPEGRERFARPDGVTTVLAGDQVCQKDLADTLELIATDGPAVMYSGDIARRIVEWSDANDGLITARDLAEYSVQEHAPTAGTWHGETLISTPSPSSGGALVTYGLQVLEVIRERDRLGRVDPDTIDGARLMVAAMVAANAVRGEDFERELYGGDLGRWIRNADVVGRGVQIVDGILSGTVNPTTVKWPSSRLGSTTHVSVVDDQGNAISMTTSTGCGSGEFAGTTGIHMNNMLGESDLIPLGHTLHPGDRLTSMMAPTIAIRNGRPVVSIGSAGSNRLRSAIFQGIVRVSDGSASLVDRIFAATHSGRIHPEAGVVHVEPDVPLKVVHALEADGHDVVRWSERSLYFGGLNGVACDDGEFAASGDPRRGGAGAVVRADGTIDVRW